jgi:hydroxymethylpyrimidine pyrophosphatase-like HAD family hydrolase
MKKNIIFEYIEVDEYSDWGTQKEWFEEIKKHTTYIFDVDGVLVKHCEKYGKNNWLNSFEPIDENIKYLKKLSDQKCEIIFLTSRSKDAVKEFLSYIDSQNINYKTIITECNTGKRVIVNEFAPSNPYPSCEALSIHRNTSIKQFLN